MLIPTYHEYIWSMCGLLDLHFVSGLHWGSSLLWMFAVFWCQRHWGRNAGSLKSWNLDLEFLCLVHDVPLGTDTAALLCTWKARFFCLAPKKQPCQPTLEYYAWIIQEQLVSHNDKPTLSLSMDPSINFQFMIRFGYAFFVCNWSELQFKVAQSSRSVVKHRVCLLVYFIWCAGECVLMNK